LRFFTGLLTFIVYSVFIGGFVISILYGEGLWTLGLGALVGFYISWSIAGGVIFSPFSYFVLSDWELFKKKLSYSIGGGTLGFLLGLVLGYVLGYFE